MYLESGEGIDDDGNIHSLYSSHTSVSLNSSATRCGSATRSCIGTGSRLLRLPPALLEDDEREEHGVEHRRKLGVHAQAQALRKSER